MKYHKQDGLKQQKCILSEFWKGLFIAPPLAPGALGIPWPVATSLQLCLHCHMTSSQGVFTSSSPSMCLSLCRNFPFLGGHQSY